VFEGLQAPEIVDLLVGKQAHVPAASATDVLLPIIGRSSSGSPNQVIYARDNSTMKAYTERDGTLVVEWKAPVTWIP